VNTFNQQEARSKIPEVTLVFWIIKIAATTLGETGGDTVTMTLNWGYLAGTALFLAALVVFVVLQIVADKFHPILYWTTIVASTTFGTTMADFADRSLGIGYTGGSALLAVLLAITLGLWRWSEGTIAVNTVSTAKVEAFYWAAITFSQTLGTALGDWMADTGGLGYEGGALIFGAGLLVVVALYAFTGVSRVSLFWAAFILTRPLGATVGDFLDKPVAQGGMALSRPLASALLAAFIVACVLVLPQRAGTHPLPNTAEPHRRAARSARAGPGADLSAADERTQRSPCIGLQLVEQDIAAAIGLANQALDAAVVGRRPGLDRETSRLLSVGVDFAPRLGVALIEIVVDGIDQVLMTVRGAIGSPGFVERPQHTFANVLAGRRGIFLADQPRLLASLRRRIDDRLAQAGPLV
jgi:uncharacterized membrane-anchored protein